MKEERWGMVLAGGGGKGAYQIGVMRALVEEGWHKFIDSVAGSSIGALNAVLYAQGSIESAEEIWRQIKPEEILDIDLSSGQIIEELQQKYTAFKEFLGSVSLEEYLGKTIREGICSREGLKKIIKNKVDLRKVKESKCKVYATIAYMQDGMPKAKYPVLNYMEEEKMLRVLLASSALPVVYDAVNIDGIEYRDGGIADNLPCKPIRQEGIKNLIVVPLKSQIVQPQKREANEEYVLTIAPSHNLGDFVSGTINFEHENILYRIALGYYDAKIILKERIRAEQGKPTDRLEFKMQMMENHNRAIQKVKQEKLKEKTEGHFAAFRKYETMIKT